MQGYGERERGQAHDHEAAALDQHLTARGRTYARNRERHEQRRHEPVDQRWQEQREELLEPDYTCQTMSVVMCEARTPRRWPQPRC